MNLFLDYQLKIYKSLTILKKKDLLVIPSKIKTFSVELPPKNQNADISCNAAMILAKVNNNNPMDLAEKIKIHLLKNFKEFKKIEVAKPGFLNIYFHMFFWKKYLKEILKLKGKYGKITGT